MNEINQIPPPPICWFLFIKKIYVELYQGFVLGCTLSYAL